VKRAVLIAAVVAALATAGFALGSGVSVTLGPSGPQPKVVSVHWGDTVSIVNGDGVTHGITSPRPDLQAPALAPGATYTNVVTFRTGTYQYRQTGGKSFPGDIVVSVTGTVSLKASTLSVVYGRTIALRGVSSIVSTPVLVEQRPRGARDWKPLATLQAADDGSFSTTAKLALGTNLRASVASGQIRSGVLRVAVRPSIAISSNAKKTLAGRTIDVRARMAPANGAKRLTLLACAVTTGAWKKVAAKRPGPGGGALFRWKAQAGKTLLRVVINHRDSVDGYTPTTSARIAVTAKGALPAKRHNARPRRAC
jgi:plastocyanin